MNHGPFGALIVDFGGVLTTPLQDAMVRFAAGAGIELQDIARAALGAYSGGEDELVVGFETGLISEDDFAKGFARRLKEQTGKDFEPDGLVRKIFSGIQLEDSMLEAVAAARAAGLRTGLLSNSWGTSLYPLERLQGLFDEMVISGEVGLRKPDPAIFELTTSRLGVDPRQCVFVDDHPGHLEAASAVGMTTVLHRSPAQTISELESILGLTLA